MIYNVNCIFQPRDRIHNICHELMTTEAKYVDRLGILVMVIIFANEGQKHACSIVIVHTFYNTSEKRKHTFKATFY